MITTEIKLRVRYAETDQMGYVYYGNYAQYYEIGRVEWLRSTGFSYNEMEKRGIMLPVLTLNVKYIKPIFYDDEITIRTIVTELPKTRMAFQYKLLNGQGILVNEGETTHVFASKSTRRPCVIPDFILERIQPLF